MRLRVAGLALLAIFAAVCVYAQEKPDALELYRASRYDDAIKVCLQELQDTPNNIESHVVLGWSYLRLKQYQNALDIGLKAIRISRSDPRIVQILGESYVFLGKIDDALRYLEEYVALRPNGDRIARVYWLMGECFITLQQYQNADIALSTAVYYEQNNAQWWARLGYARERAEEFKWASDAYQRSLTLDPNLEDAASGKERVDKKLRG